LATPRLTRRHSDSERECIPIPPARVPARLRDGRAARARSMSLALVIFAVATSLVVAIVVIVLIVVVGGGMLIQRRRRRGGVIAARRRR
jgi:hypothetical protein